MLHTSSNRGTPTSNDITKILRQHYRPPSPKPYKHEVVQCRNETTCKKDKPEDYWTVNFYRRQNNLDSGFYSTPWEPYRPIGGDLILDPFELVTSSLPGNIDKKFYPKSTRRATVYQITERLLSASSARKQTKAELPPPSEDSIDTCPTAGFDNIKKFVKESSERMVAVRSGMSYEEHVRQAEDRLREEEELANQPDPDDMVIQSTSASLIMPIVHSPSPRFDTVTEDEDIGSLRSSRTGSTATSGVSERRMSHSPADRWKSMTSPIRGRRRSSYRPPQKRVSLVKVNSGVGTCLLRQERMCRDHLEFLTAIYSILTALHNMKVKDLRSRVPLSKEVVEKLQKEGRESQNNGVERSDRLSQVSKVMPRRGRKMSSIDFDQIGSERVASASSSFHKPSAMSNKSRWSRKMMSTDTMDMTEQDSERGGGGRILNLVKRMDNVGKAFGRRRSKVCESQPQSQRPALETWEDFLNVQPQEYREDPSQSFGLQVGIISKFMRWYRRASVAPVHGGANVLPSIDKDQLQHLEEVKERGLAEKDQREMTHQPCASSAMGNQEKTKKLAIWQQVAQEKSTVFLNKKSTTPNPYSMIQRMHEDTNKMKRSLQKENTAALEKLAREKVANFRLKFSALSKEECSPLYSEQIYKLQQVKENVHRSHLENFDVQPSKWYEELREKSQTSPYCDEQQICDMIIKLQTYSHMDNKTVSYAKAKLCLLMMSLPAYSICKIQTQRALKFIFEQVLLGAEAQFDEWLNHRKIPYIVQEGHTEPRHSLISPLPHTFKSNQARSPSPNSARRNSAKGNHRRSASSNRSN